MNDTAESGVKNIIKYPKAMPEPMAICNSLNILANAGKLRRVAKATFMLPNTENQ